jgi:hypothetical protein
MPCWGTGKHVKLVEADKPWFEESTSNIRSKNPTTGNFAYVPNKYPVRVPFDKSGKSVLIQNKSDFGHDIYITMTSFPAWVYIIMVIITMIFFVYFNK